MTTSISDFTVDDEPLIGDNTIKYSLPICSSTHQDLKGITPATVSYTPWPVSFLSSQDHLYFEFYGHE